MFNNTGESKMSEKTKVFLIIKKTYWEHDGDTWFDVAEHADTKERAEKCIDALNTLNQDKKVSYLVSEVAYENK
jgi:hypothetical protein